MSEELKPCPFCGCTDVYSDTDTCQIFGELTGHNFTVACSNCEATAIGDDTLAEAIIEWNTRADLLPVVKPLVWENILGEVWRSEHRRSHFYECLYTPDGWICYEMVHGVGRQIGDIWPDVEAAKAAAQADYETRIRACLDMIDPAALVAGAYEAAAMQFDGWDNVPVQMTYDESRDRISALTPADAQAALDAAIAKAVNKKLDAVAEYFTQIEKAYYEEATRPMPEHIRRMAAKMNGIARDAQNAILTMKEPE